MNTSSSTPENPGPGISIPGHEESLLPSGTQSLADYIPLYEDTTARIRKIISGYQVAQIFFSALEHDFFSYLETPTTSHELAGKTGIDNDLIELMAGALVQSDILGKDGKLFYLLPEVFPFLSQKSPFFAQYLTDTHAHRQYWQDLTSRIKTKSQPIPFSSLDTPESVRYTGKSSLLGRLQATMDVIRTIPDVQNCKRILDLGGGHGLFSISLAQEFPNAHITLVDLPDICPIAFHEIESSGYHDRITIQEMDFRVQSIRDRYDLILDLGAFGGSKVEIQKWFNRIANSLTSGGYYVRSAFTLDDDITGPDITLLFEIEEIISGRNQRHLTHSEMSSYFSHTGMDIIRYVDLKKETGFPIRVVVTKKRGEPNYVHNNQKMHQ